MMPLLRGDGTRPIVAQTRGPLCVVWIVVVRPMDLIPLLDPSCAICRRGSAGRVVYGSESRSCSKLVIFFTEVH